MNECWSECIRTLTPYTPGEQPRIERLVKLNTNENPYPPSPAVLDALRGACNQDLRLYPDPEGTLLREALARHYGLKSEQIFLGNGSDEVLAHVFHALLKHERPILYPDVTYSFYPVYCALYGIDYQTIPLDENLQVDVEDYRREHGGIILPNPNAPTGAALPLARIRELLEICPDKAVVIDEAYVDFGAESAVSLIDEYPNLLVVQTLSKSRSLAGLRIGFAMGNVELIAALNMVKNCFNSYPLDRLAQVGALAAIEDQEHFEATRRRIMDSRVWLVERLGILGFEVVPSMTNFVFCRHRSRSAADLQQELRARRILVRHFSQPRIDNYLRITIGTPQECQQLVDALTEVL